MAANTITPPEAKDRLISTVVSFLVAGFLFLIPGFLFGGIALVVWGQGTPGYIPGASGMAGRGFVEAVSINTPGWFTPVTVIVALLFAAVGASRFGRGTVGDSVGSIRALDKDGNAPSKWQNILRTLTPLALVGVGAAIGHIWLLVAVVLLLAFSAVLRADRLSPFELLAGIKLDSTAARKSTREDWLREAQASKDAQAAQRQHDAGETPSA